MTDLKFESGNLVAKFFKINNCTVAYRCFLGFLRQWCPRMLIQAAGMKNYTPP